jgi:SpoVK/Ycf46/Vps4 family AAA+-type ATPase
MTYSMPDDASRSEYIRLLIGDFKREEHILEQTCELLKGCSYADIEQIALKAKRKAIIESSPLTYRNIHRSYEEYKPKSW